MAGGRGRKGQTPALAGDRIPSLVAWAPFGGSVVAGTQACVGIPNLVSWTCPPSIRAVACAGGLVPNLGGSTPLNGRADTATDGGVPSLWGCACLFAVGANALAGGRVFDLATDTNGELGAAALTIDKIPNLGKGAFMCLGARAIAHFRVLDLGPEATDGERASTSAAIRV